MQIKRPGKTKRDKESGAWARRLENREGRAASQKDPKMHPWDRTWCNGKKNRYLVTGKKGKPTQIS